MIQNIFILVRYVSASLRSARYFHIKELFLKQLHISQFVFESNTAVASKRDDSLVFSSSRDFFLTPLGNHVGYLYTYRPISRFQHRNGAFILLAQHTQKIWFSYVTLHYTRPTNIRNVQLLGAIFFCLVPLGKIFKQHFFNFAIQKLCVSMKSERVCQAHEI